MPQDNILVSGISLEAYRTARQHSGVIDRADRGRIVLSGRDRASYLHGLLTNDITALKAGEGRYAAYLTPQGRMITDLWVYELGETMLVTLDLSRKDMLLARLDQFIFAEDVQLGDVTGSFSGFAVIGPQASRIAASVLRGITAEVLAALPEHGNLRAEFEGTPAIVLQVTDPGLAGYEVLVERAAHARLHDELRRLGAADLDPITAEAIRIEAGVPRFGRDMDSDTIPLEAGIESRAISLTKGCYVGQEVIIRVLHRGHGRVARRLVGLTVDAESPPAVGAVVMADGREIGHVTSSTVSPALGKPIAMGYLHRDFVSPGVTVSAGGLPAVVAALPFISGNGSLGSS